MSKIENAVQWMINTANNNSHGYDQSYRWGEKGDYDCSSAVITAWQTSGVPVKSNGATYTGNMYNAFKRSGFSDVTSSVDRSNGSGLKRGDVLLTRGKHTSMFIGSGQIVQASINEKGKAIGGVPGDQTGREFWIRSYYNYPWEYVLRYNEPEPARKSNTEIAQEVRQGKWGNGANRVTRLKNAGYDPKEIQSLVNSYCQIVQSQRKTDEEIAQEVRQGKWGNGADRVTRLKNAGYDPATIQRIVNSYCQIVQKQRKTDEAIAKEVIRGLWGNGSDRKRRLKNAGYDPEKIRQIVNRIYYG